MNTLKTNGTQSGGIQGTPLAEKPSLICFLALMEFAAYRVPAVNLRKNTGHILHVFNKCKKCPKHSLAKYVMSSLERNASNRFPKNTSFSYKFCLKNT